MAGNAYTIEISIQRNSNSTSFSKYYLDLPEGFLVKEHNSLNGSFAFEPTQKRAKIIWSETPAESMLKFSMVIEILPNAQEEAYFKQKYSFIDGEQKKEILSEPLKVKIFHGVSSGEIKFAQASVPQKESELTKLDTDFQKKQSNMNITIENHQTSKFMNELKKEYKIQVSASAVRPTNLAKYKKWGKTSIYEENGLYKLMVGSFPTKEDAKKKLTELKENGIDGFIVYFENGIKK